MQEEEKDENERRHAGWIEIRHGIESLFGSDAVVGPTPPHGERMGVALRWADDCRLCVEIDPETLDDFSEQSAYQRDEAVRRWLAILSDYKDAAEPNYKEGESPTVLLARNW
ncbi:hypothetical protein [Algiphilus sp.]|uniref:hypothetical protein n=1 Tax=Algiphilus sp. TaxID=1872431 RepID=UPI003BAC8D52